MTRLPAENRNVVGIDYDAAHPKYKVGPLCAVPGCSKLADHAHHIWRRSFLTGDYGWVQLEDGAVVQNLCGLCYMHHNDVTENRAVIAYWRLDGSRWFTWEDSRGEFHLEPQPKIWGSSNATESGGGASRDNDAAAPDSPVTSNGPVGPAHSEKCPTCKRALRPKEATKTEGKRPRKNWTITVPVDERENGADVLDTLMDECAKIFGHDETRALRYFTLAQALALVVSHGHLMVGDG